MKDSTATLSWHIFSIVLFSSYARVIILCSIRYEIRINSECALAQIAPHPLLRAGRG